MTRTFNPYQFTTSYAKGYSAGYRTAQSGAEVSTEKAGQHSAAWRQGVSAGFAAFRRMSRR